MDGAVERGPLNSLSSDHHDDYMGVPRVDFSRWVHRWAVETHTSEFSPVCKQQIALLYPEYARYSWVGLRACLSAVQLLYHCTTHAQRPPHP